MFIDIISFLHIAGSGLISGMLSLGRKNIVFPMLLYVLLNDPIPPPKKLDYILWLNNAAADALLRFATALFSQLFSSIFKFGFCVIIPVTLIALPPFL